MVKCKEKDCPKNGVYNFPDKKNAEYCSKHRKYDKYCHKKMH